MLSLNRDVLTEVCPVLSLINQRLTLSPQEYDKCFHLVQDCVPHARLPYQPTSIDSFREHHSTTRLLWVLTLNRTAYLPHVALAYDAPSTNISRKMERLRYLEWKTLDRAGERWSSTLKVA
jgi:hypothetical protein